MQVMVSQQVIDGNGSGTLDNGLGGAGAEERSRAVEGKSCS